MGKHILRYALYFVVGSVLSIKTASSQTAPNISYTTPANYSVGVAIPALAPANSGGAVTALAFGTGVQLTGATLSNPYGMAVDPSGNIYVANFGNNTVSKYNSTGTYQGTFGSTAISNPAGIAFDKNGNGYVLNYNRTNNGNGNVHGNGNVTQYNSSGVYQSTIIQGLGTGNGITIDASSNIDIAEGSYNGGNNTVEQYNTSGSLSFSLNSTYTVNPVAVATDGSGNIYVLDNTNKNVTKYSSSGVYLSTVISGLGSPNAIYVDGAGDIYIGDTGAQTVKVYSPAGVLITTKTGLTDPEGFVTDSKGNLYVSDYTNNTVTKYPVAGGYYLNATLPAGLSFDSATGTFSGTPTVAFGTITYTVTAYNSNGTGTTTVTLTCPVNPSAPGISYNPSVNVFTTNSSVSLSPVVTNSPTGYSISPALPTNGTLTFNAFTGVFSGTPTATSAAALYTVTASNSFGSSSTTVSITCLRDNYWTGQGNNANWSTNNNWSTHQAPVATDLASIGVVNYTGSEPVIPNNTAVNANYVTFGANAGTLTINAGAVLTINKVLTVNNNATPTLIGVTTGSVKIAPLAVVNITGNGVLNITNSATANLVTLQSDATGSATIGQITTGFINGKVNVERYFQGSNTFTSGRFIERGYRIISSPVNIGTTVGGNNVYGLNYIVGSTAGQTTGASSTTNAFVTGCVGCNTGAGNPTLYLYREDRTPNNSSFTSGNYIGISNIVNSTTAGTIGASDGGTYSIPVGNGVFFFFRGAANNWTTRTKAPGIAPENVTLTSSGNLNQGTITVNNWFTPSAGLSNGLTGYNMVGNPYASSIDLETSTYGTNPGGIITSNLDASFYEFNPQNQQFEPYMTSLHAGVGKATNIIASGQGFFVHATSPGPAILQFKETAKSSTSQNTGVNLLMGKPVEQPVAQQMIRLKLVTDSVNYSDMIIGFNSAASTMYNGREDAKYLAGSGAAEALYCFSKDNNRLSINTLPLPKQSAESIRLNVTVAKSGTYTFEKTLMTAIPKIYRVWLIDKYKKDSLDLSNNRTYAFDVNLSDTASYGSNRFSMVIRQDPALNVHLLNFTATKTVNGASLVWKTENEHNYTNFTVERSTDNGKNFVVLGGNLSDASGDYSFLDKAPSATTNWYRLKIEDLNGTISYSKIVILTYGNPGSQGIISNITVYPNPTTESVNLTIKQTTVNTNYNIRVTNNMGSVVKTANLNQSFWQSDVSSLLPGMYFITVLNKADNTVVGQTNFVKL